MSPILLSRVWRAAPEVDQRLVRLLAQSLGIDRLTAQVLVQRGIHTFDEARAYFKPAWADLHDPFLMKDMDIAARRLANALQQQEKVVVYGDYDVDGTTSVAVVVHFLDRYRVPYEYYTPDRMAEGYGLSRNGVEFAHSVGASLLLVLDCGTKDLTEIAYARELGLDVIVCDHHEPGPELPVASAFLNPKQPGCPYPFKELCACAVAFKLVQATDTLLNLGFDTGEVIDRVAVALACDLVPMVGENRTLAALGLERLVERPSRGLAALMALSDKARRWRISDVVFFLGPRINAAGRIGHANAAVDLLLGQLPHLEPVARELDLLNKERQNLERGYTEQALAQAAALGTDGLVVHQPDWHKGVVGIVAAKLVEHFHRPAVVLTRDSDGWVGSARSVPGFDLYAALEACKAHLRQFGGHTQAAGLSLTEPHLERFREAFATYCQTHLDDAARRPVQLIDGVMELKDVTDKFARLHQRMEPFGPENRRPVFAAFDLNVVEARQVGEGHLRLRLAQGQTTLTAIGFGLWQAFQEIPEGTPLAIAFYPDMNHWQGNTTLQLHLKDLKPSRQAAEELRAAAT